MLICSGYSVRDELLARRVVITVFTKLKSPPTSTESSNSKDKWLLERETLPSTNIPGPRITPSLISARVKSLKVKGCVNSRVPEELRVSSINC